MIPDLFSDMIIELRMLTEFLLEKVEAVILIRAGPAPVMDEMVALLFPPVGQGMADRSNRVKHHKPPAHTFLQSILSPRITGRGPISDMSPFNTL